MVYFISFLKVQQRVEFAHMIVEDTLFRGQILDCAKKII